MVINTILIYGMVEKKRNEIANDKEKCELAINSGYRVVYFSVEYVYENYYKKLGYFQEVHILTESELISVLESLGIEIPNKDKIKETQR